MEIAAQYYFDIYNYLLLFIFAFVYVHNYILSIDNSKNITFGYLTGWTTLMFLILFIGLRPLSIEFVDMGAYARYFNAYKHGADILSEEDVFFHYFMKATSQWISLKYFFLLCALLYIIPCYVISKKYFKSYWFYAFLILVGSFSFWGYGVNGLRNGIATAMFIMGLAYYKNKLLLFFFLVISALIHSSMALPVIALIISLVFNNTKSYLLFWLISIPLSFLLGGFFISFFTSIGIGGERLGEYLSSPGGGFRIDFIIYSASAVLTGWHFIFKLKFKDEIYEHIFNVYLITNSFWILVIRASFSNRFAYLSWFLIGLVIIYPFLKSNHLSNKNRTLGHVMIAYYSFTFIMYLING